MSAQWWTHKVVQNLYRHMQNTIEEAYNYYILHHKQFLYCNLHKVTTADHGCMLLCKLHLAAASHVYRAALVTACVRACVWGEGILV